MDQSGGKCQGMLSKTAVAKMFPNWPKSLLCHSHCPFCVTINLISTRQIGMLWGEFPEIANPGDVSKALVVLHKI
jgi:hypothetical protein